MGNLLVVVGHPAFAVLAYLVEVAEHVHVEHTAPVVAIEAFDETVLDRVTGLDEVQHNALVLRQSANAVAMNSGPLAERSGNVVRTRPSVPNRVFRGLAPERQLRSWPCHRATAASPAAVGYGDR